MIEPSRQEHHLAGNKKRPWTAALMYTQKIYIYNFLHNATPSIIHNLLLLKCFLQKEKKNGMN